MNSEADFDKTNETTPFSVTTPSEEEFTGIISHEALRLIETVVNGGILPVLVLCGVTGNVIIMVVFARQGLAISDTGFNLFHLASRTFVIFNLFDTDLGGAWQARAFWLTGAYLGFLLTSNTLTLLISLQRCIIVVSPLSAKSLPSARLKEGRLGWAVS
nr:hypothetical protein BaRGS_009206 [Batillaria attramentaria]